jgi:hypothetical protein
MISTVVPRIVKANAVINAAADAATATVTLTPREETDYYQGRRKDLKGVLI